MLYVLLFFAFLVYWSIRSIKSLKQTPQMTVLQMIRKAQWLGTITCTREQTESCHSTPFEVYLYQDFILLSTFKDFNFGNPFLLVTTQQWENEAIRGSLGAGSIYLLEIVAYHYASRNMVLMGNLFSNQNTISRFITGTPTRIEILKSDPTLLQQFDQLWANYIGDERQKYRSFGLDL